MGSRICERTLNELCVTKQRNPSGNLVSFSRIYIFLVTEGRRDERRQGKYAYWCGFTRDSRLTCEPLKAALPKEDF